VKRAAISRRSHRRGPTIHWVLLALSLVILTVALLISGLVNGQVGEGANTPHSRDGVEPVPPVIAGGGPVVDPTRPGEAGLSVPARHVALTFDDGPTRWTEEILDVLQSHQVPATFFVVGARASARPDLVRRMYAEGHEVGVHTFTHVNAANVTPWRLGLELDQSQLAIAAATGHTTSLLRLPYSSGVDAIRSSEWEAVRRAGNYRVVYADLDTKDWARPGADAIVQAGLPDGDQGAVIMLHDGGGDRGQTVAALDLLIPELKRRGYTFDTVTSAVGLTGSWHTATDIQRWQGELVSLAVRSAGWLSSAVKAAFVGLALLAVLRSALLVAFARRHVRLGPPSPRARRWQLPPVSVVVPAYNEEIGISATVRSLVDSDYPNLDVVVVDDGSTDGTAAVVAGLGLPGVRLIRQPNSGKPAALSAGIAAAEHDILVLVDADTVFEPHAVRELVGVLANPDVGAVSGNTKVGNRRSMLGRWQHIEYVIGFNLDRRMFDVLRCMPTVPGAIGAFRREAIADAGGVTSDTLAEDTDLTMAIIRAGWRVVYAPLAQAWTEAPATLGQLWRQRYRWCYGTMQAMWKHRAAIAESGSGGKLGRRGLPYLLAFQVLLPLLAPLVDVATVYSVVVSAELTLLYAWLAFLALQLVTAIYAFRLDGEPLRPLWSLPLQQVVYRQLMYLVVIQSVSSALYGLRLRWQVIRRSGEMDAVPVAARTSPVS
jgi:cellulose synthase/poly-beta-1,6-N-acetylglucosamine synthase-like glycosyltransferase/peptidoglycan/xylan/chitin deacetylase (PgdA/CDA1 family)